MINYVRDFISHVSTYISLLTKILMKNALDWGNYTVQKIKEISKDDLTLHIPSNENMILHTNGIDNH